MKLILHSEVYRGYQRESVKTSRDCVFIPDSDPLLR